MTENYLIGMKTDLTCKNKGKGNFIETETNLFQAIQEVLIISDSLQHVLRIHLQKNVLQNKFLTICSAIVKVCSTNVMVIINSL